MRVAHANQAMVWNGVTPSTDINKLSTEDQASDPRPMMNKAHAAIDARALNMFGIFLLLSSLNEVIITLVVKQ